MFGNTLAWINNLTCLGSNPFAQSLLIDHTTVIRNLRKITTIAFLLRTNVLRRGLNRTEARAAHWRVH